MSSRFTALSHFLFHRPVRWWVLPVISGLMVGVSFPSYPFIRLEPLAWIGFVPLFIAHERCTSAREFFRITYTALFTLCLVSVWWVSLSTVAGGVLMLFTQSLFSSLPFMALFVMTRILRIPNSVLYFPFVFVLWEWIYLDLAISFGWLTLGNSQANLWPMIQYADLTGVWGISLWIMLVNVLVFQWVKAHSIPEHLTQYSVLIKRIPAIVIALVLLPIGYSALKIWEPVQEHRQITVTIVQPNIDPFEKWLSGARRLMDKQLDAVHHAITDTGAPPPDLVLLPETAFPFYLRSAAHQSTYEALVERVQNARTSLLAGFADVVFYSNPDMRQVGAKFDPYKNTYYDTFNSSFVMTPGGRSGAEYVQVYHKMKLVPFAERVPYMEVIPFISELTFSVAGISSWGRGLEPLNFSISLSSQDSVRFPGLICYESIYPGFVATFVASGATMLTVITNDGWFSKSYGPYQHAAFAKLRCIETRRAMARCANTGISLFIDRLGRGYGEVDWWKDTYTTASVPQYTSLSFYVKYPDLVPKLSAFLLFSLLLSSVIRRVLIHFSKQSLS